MKKVKILCAFANPQKTVPLQLDKEKKLIREAINYSKNKNKIKLTIIDADTIHDFRRALLDDDFQIVHVSSHGTNSGLILADEFGHPHQIPQHALAELLSDYKSIECLVLNACYSVSQAALIDR